MPKSLVIYYSRTGNTKFVAERIASELGAEIEEVSDLKNRKGWLRFLKAGYDATLGKETKISEAKKSPRDFELIAVGTPVWNSRPSPATRTYLRRIDLSGKKVAVFCTSEGTGSEKALARLKSLIPNGNIVGAITISKTLEDQEETENKISAWCKGLKSI
jgi:flavodoxin